MALRNREFAHNGLDCCWETRGKRCQLLGTISPHTGGEPKFYCCFHYDMLSRKEFNYQIFSDWLEGYKQQWPLERYGVDQFDKKGNFTGKKGHPFHRLNVNELWELIGG